MKHPKYRCKDILFMDKEAVKELFSFIWEAAKVLPFYSEIVDIELCGSLAFGNNGLGSDVDFNLAAKDYNDQVSMMRWMRTAGATTELHRILMDFEKKTGLHLDVGAVDPANIKYTVCASTKKFELYNRGRGPLPFFEPGKIVHYPLFSDKPLTTINILDFDPETDTPPEVFPYHLRFSPYLHYFLAEPRQWERRSKWNNDEWAEDVPYWRSRYGERFQDYREVNGELVGV